VDLGEWVYRQGKWEAVEEVSGTPSEEIQRQHARFCELVGREPTHLDSHQHVHREQEVGALMADLALKLRIPLRGSDSRVRYCGNFYGQTAKGEPLPGAIGVRALLDLVAGLPLGMTELGCHPGLETYDDVPYGIERSIEVQTLCDPYVRSELTSLGIVLCSFADLH
jgi:predicted glycoside hydrolase/deacetylase ChbG (UPF0249 family)